MSITDDIKVGYTLLSKNNQLYRITLIDDYSVFAERIGYVDTDGREHKSPVSEFVWPVTTVTRTMRIVSRNAEKYDAYLATLP